MDTFGTEGAEESEGTRENFIGKVVRSEVDTDEERFQTQYENDMDIVYEIEVLSEDWENLFELGLNGAEALNSKFKVFIGHLENIHGSLADHGVEGFEDLAEFLEGRVYEFKDQDMTADEEFTFEERSDSLTVNFSELFSDMDNPPNQMILPVREVTDEDELADLGTEGGGDVEEVDVDDF